MEADVTRPRPAAVLLSGALLASLVACGNKDDSGDLPSLGTSTTTSSAPTPTASAASPTPTAVPTRSSQKYGALTLVLDHSAQPPANAQAALRAYEDYERSSHKSMATNVEDPNLAKRSAGAALQDIRGVLKDQKATGVRTGGLVTVTVKLVGAGAAVAAFSGCYDQSKSLLVRANGTSYIGPETKKAPHIQIAVVVTNVTGQWMVTEYNLKGDKC
jgi:hypothetical protein